MCSDRAVTLALILEQTASQTLQQAQMNALLSLLNLNDPISAASPTVGKASTGLKLSATSGPPVWKILVLDQQTKDVLATVLRVQDLRDIGVTLHVYVVYDSRF